jgi:TAG lipase / steryl ester hydrolase / phospholipase A2 / LPA acyltransferase
MEDLVDVDWLWNQWAEDTLRVLVDHVIPVVQQYTVHVLRDLVFCPRVVAKQLLLAVVLESGRLVMSQTYHSLYRGMLVHLVSRRARRVRHLQQEQAVVTTQQDYMQLAEQIDAVTGDQEWRMNPHCHLYESDRIVSTIHHYLHLMRRGAVFELLFLLRGSNLNRHRFGLLNRGLFNRAQAGTKVLVETYHNVVCSALEFVCDANHHHTDIVMGESSADHRNYSLDVDETHVDYNNIPTEARLAFFNEVRHAYGRYVPCTPAWRRNETCKLCISHSSSSCCSFFLT